MTADVILPTAHGTCDDARVLTADDVLNTRFRAVKLEHGYDQDEVDDFLDRVMHTLRARETGTTPSSPVTAQDVADVRFQATRFREGYAMTEVDDLLDRVATTLGAPARADGAPTSHLAVPPPPPATLAGIIEPRRGWLRRLLGR